MLVIGTPIPDEPEPEPEPEPDNPNGGGNEGQSGDNKHKYGSGNMNGDTVISCQLGQKVWITIKNVNVLGTTIRITDTLSNQTDERIILPLGKAEFEFTKFGSQPIYWNFSITTVSDAFIVNYEIYSTWVPGMN